MEGKVLRDRFGFLIASDFEHLAKIYAPLYEREEEDRQAAWTSFLNNAAEELGIDAAGAAAAAAPDANSSGAAAAAPPSAPPPLAALAAAVIARITSEPSAGTLPSRLTQMVHGGIPTGLRSVIWPVLLRAGKVAPAGQYDILVKIVEEVEAAGEGAGGAWGPGGEDEEEPGESSCAHRFGLQFGGDWLR
jgi:hypothetical protein